MVPNLFTFNPKIHVKRSDLGESVNHQGLKMTTIHVLVTKATRIDGESLYWAKQDGASDPEEAMWMHLEVNNPPASFHLFGYPNSQGTMTPMFKKTFTTWISKAAVAASLPQLKGHSIHIGATLKYLLRGLLFNVMKAKGWWNGDTFHKYLHDHARVLAPYMQKAPLDIHDQFI